MKLKRNKIIISLQNMNNPVGNAMQLERERALSTFMSSNGCCFPDELNELGMENLLSLDYSVRDWSTLKWRVEELIHRKAIPIGFTKTTQGFHAVPGQTKWNVVHLYAVPPNDKDPNVYSIHCEIPPADEDVLLWGPQRVEELLEFNWLIGFNNGVRNFNLGTSDVLSTLHYKTAIALENVMTQIIP